MILFPQSFTATRKNQTWVNGIATDGTPTSVPFIGDMQPLSNKDAVALNIGRADIGKITVFSDRALQETRQGPSGSLCGDFVVFQGQNYEIIQESAHGNKLLPHWTYFAELRE
jgi:hypothetical protein